jgi:hypothetical protein
MHEASPTARDWEPQSRRSSGRRGAGAGAWGGHRTAQPTPSVDLLLLPFSPSREGEAFVDAELPAIFALQDGDGSAGAGYLDGNVIRTALLYAGWKSAGVSPRPPREDLALGAERTPDGSGIILHLAAARPGRDACLRDRRGTASLVDAFDYPRRNAQPEGSRSTGGSLPGPDLDRRSRSFAGAALRSRGRRRRVEGRSGSEIRETGAVARDGVLS